MHKTLSRCAIEAFLVDMLTLYYRVGYLEFPMDLTVTSSTFAGIRISNEFLRHVTAALEEAFQNVKTIVWRVSERPSGKRGLTALALFRLRELRRSTSAEHSIRSRRSPTGFILFSTIFPFPLFKIQRWTSWSIFGNGLALLSLVPSGKSTRKRMLLQRDPRGSSLTLLSFLPGLIMKRRDYHASHFITFLC